MKQILTILLASIFATFIVPHTTQSQETSTLTARQIAQRSFPSVVLLVTEDASGKLFALGSGFFVQSDVIATNYHVIENASRIYTRLVGQKDVYEINGTVGTDKARDLALLKVTGVRAQPLPLGNINDVAVGDTVYTLGNPEGFEGTFSQGIVSALRGKRYIQITAPISHGSSGGPVLNQKGEVIGVASSGFDEGQNLNFAIPVPDLASLVSRMSSTINPLPAPSISTAQANESINTRQDNAPPRRSPFFRPARCGAHALPSEVENANDLKKLVNHGETYLQTKQYENAIGVYDRVIHLKPLLAEPYYKMSLAYAAIGCTDEAILAAKQAVANEPRNTFYKEYLEKLSR